MDLHQAEPQGHRLWVPTFSNISGNEDSEPRRQPSGKANEGPQTETPETLFNVVSSLDLDSEPQGFPDKPSLVLPTDRRQHDLGHLMYHRHLEDFGMQLQKAAEATMITDRKSNYARVSRVYDLGHLLSKHYDFDVKRWALPINKKSHQEVYRKMYELVEDDNQMHLRIVFYNGPACLSEQGETGTSNFDGGNGVTSLIAACSFNTVACRMSQNSFIEVLIRQLKIVRSLPSFSSAYLYGRIYQDIQTQIKSSEHAPRELPVHLILSQDPTYPRDILLSANRHKDIFRRDHRSDQPSDSSDKSLSRCPSPTRKGWHDEGYADHHLPLSQETMPSRYPRLLLSFRLLEDMDPEALRIDLFSHRLGSLPIPVDSVKVEAGFSSDSTILLVSVPVAMLPFLPRDPSITIIGTIDSSNLLFSTPWVVEGQDLALKDYHLPVVYIENPHEMSDRMSRNDFLLKTPTVAHAQPNSWDAQYARSFQLNPEFERSWLTVKIGTRYLIASTSAQHFNCYVFDLDIGKYIYADLGVWDRVDLPWPKVHKVAISPDEETVAFVSGLAGGEKGIEGSQVYCLPLATFTRPDPCLNLQGPVEEVEDLTLNDLGDGYVVVRSKSADESSARAAVVFYSQSSTNSSGLFGVPSTQLVKEVQPSDHIAILSGTTDNDTCIAVAQNEQLFTELIRGATTYNRTTFSRSRVVDDHILDVVGHSDNALLMVETKNSKFGCRSHLMAYRREAQRQSCRSELTELLPSLEKNSQVAVRIVEDDLLVIAVTIGQFRFAVYKIRLPKSLSAETAPWPIAQPRHKRYADALHALGLNESMEQIMDRAGGLYHDWDEGTSNSAESDLYGLTSSAEEDEGDYK
ncbi:serine/threonine protein kinase [Colletotrichum musicola]|uniref:Serine/threonine protein kinase n=1 Tax=Colletotrichum musicola TaxID=2175873 RepID=A0A8H6N2A3_9PEZI|nr:serine/threonine protein kinase [Colletotrichum musicola]